MSRAVEGLQLPAFSAKLLESGTVSTRSVVVPCFIDMQCLKGCVLTQGGPKRQLSCTSAQPCSALDLAAAEQSLFRFL